MPDHPGTKYLHKDRFTRGKGKFHVTPYVPAPELPDEEYPFVLTTGRVLTQYNVACVYSKLGELEVAFDLLERLLPHANHETKSWVRYDPDFDALRTQPRYSKVLELLE